ncbi:MAG: DUF401 family protein [Methanobacteriota archaeon]
MILTLLGVLIAFILIIVLIRKHFNFGLSLLLGALIVGVFSLDTISLLDIPKAFVEASVYSFADHQIVTETIELAILLMVVYLLAKCMQETCAIPRLIQSLKTFFSKGGTLGLIPAVYGLMPVPGGALFSAPFMDAEGEKHRLNPNQKNLLNIWFRHIWFPIYPISSAMLLICSQDFSNINIFLLMGANIPAFLAFIVIGAVFLNHYTKKPSESPAVFRKKEYRGLMFLLPPILPVFLYLVFLVFIDFATIRLYERLIFIAGVLLSILVLFFLSKSDWKTYSGILRKNVSWNLAFVIFGIMIFRQMFEVAKANEYIANVFVAFSLPALLMIVLIPFLLGLITGYNLGAVALSYFLVQPFFLVTNITIVGLTSIIFLSSLVGYLISPIHLCNVLSSDYLKTDPTRIYKLFIPASLCLLVVQVVFVVLFMRL